MFWDTLSYFHSEASRELKQSLYMMTMTLIKLLFIVQPRVLASNRDQDLRYNFSFVFYYFFIEVGEYRRKSVWKV